MNKCMHFADGSQRLEQVRFSPVRKVLERTIELENAGMDTIHFQIGEPDCNTPQPIVDATIRALRNNMTHYGPNRGLLLLRQEIAKHLSSYNKLQYNFETEILITVSGAEAIFDSIMAFVNPGDEVIIFSPAFMNYKNVIHIAGGIPIEIPLRKENNLQIDPNEVQKHITPKTKMLILNNPSNPTGVVYTDEVLGELARIVVDNGLLVLSDEMYDQILYDGTSVTSIAAFDGMRDHTITMNGFSKTFAMTGWRLGYLAAPETLIPHLLKMHQYETTCAPTFIQQGVAEAMNLPETQSIVCQMVESFSKRRKLVLDGLAAIPGITFAEPKGAFYVFPDVSGTGLSGKEFAERLLEEEGVATVPGAGFAESASDHIRISFATSEADIIKGLDRIAKFVAKLR